MNKYRYAHFVIHLFDSIWVMIFVIVKYVVCNIFLSKTELLCILDTRTSILLLSVQWIELCVSTSPTNYRSQRSLKEPMSPEETLVKLKAELSRSLQSIRSKREHVTKLQVELREAKGEGQNWRGRVEGAEARVGQVEVSWGSMALSIKRERERDRQTEREREREREGGGGQKWRGRVEGLKLMSAKWRWV